MNLDLKRLYLIYQSGSNRDGKKNSNLLQLAKSMGPDLSEAEFEALATQVSEIERQFSAKNQTKHLQAALWNLPVAAKANREAFFRPVRTKDNQPVFNDPTETSGYTATPIAASPISQGGPGPDRSDFSGAIKSFMGSNESDLHKSETLKSTAQPSYKHLIKDIMDGGKYGGKSAAEITAEIFGPKDEKPVEQPSGSPVSKSGSSGRSGGGRSLVDNLQVALDAIGVFDPTPFTDLTNSIISLVRAFRDPQKAPRHLVNAGISMLGVIPGFGDIAKLGKDYGSGGNPASNMIGQYAKSRFSEFAEDFATRKFGKETGRAVGSLFGRTGSNVAGGVAGRAAVAGAQAATAGGAAGGATTAGGAAAAAASNPVGIALVAIAATAVLTIVAFKKLNDWINKTAERGRKTLAENEHLAMYSGQLSLAMMNYHANSQMLDRTKSAYLAPALSQLARNQSALETSIQDRTNPWRRAAINSQNVGNTWAKSFSDAVGNFEVATVLLRLYFDRIDQNTPVNDQSRDELEHSIRSMGIPVPQRKLPAVLPQKKP